MAAFGRGKHARRKKPRQAHHPCHQLTRSDKRLSHKAWRVWWDSRSGADGVARNQARQNLKESAPQKRGIAVTLLENPNSTQLRFAEPLKYDAVLAWVKRVTKDRCLFEIRREPLEEEEEEEEEAMVDIQEKEEEEAMAGAPAAPAPAGGGPPALPRPVGQGDAAGGGRAQRKEEGSSAQRSPQHLKHRGEDVTKESHCGGHPHDEDYQRLLCVPRDVRRGVGEVPTGMTLVAKPDKPKRWLAMKVVENRRGAQPLGLRQVPAADLAFGNPHGRLAGKTAPLVQLGEYGAIDAGVFERLLAALATRAEVDNAAGLHGRVVPLSALGRGQCLSDAYKFSLQVDLPPDAGPHAARYFLLPPLHAYTRETPLVCDTLARYLTSNEPDVDLEVVLHALAWRRHIHNPRSWDRWWSFMRRTSWDPNAGRPRSVLDCEGDFREMWRQQVEEAGGNLDGPYGRDFGRIVRYPGARSSEDSAWHFYTMFRHVSAHVLGLFNLVAAGHLQPTHVPWHLANIYLSDMAKGAGAYALKHAGGDLGHLLRSLIQRGGDVWANACMECCADVLREVADVLWEYPTVGPGPSDFIKRAVRRRGYPSSQRDRMVWETGACRALRDALEEAAASRRTPAARRLAIASQTWPQPRIAAFDIQVFLCTAHIILYRWQGFSKAMRSAMLKEPFPQLRAAQLREGGWVWHQPQQQARRRRAAEEVAEEERAPPSDVQMDGSLEVLSRRVSEEERAAQYVEMWSKFFEGSLDDLILKTERDEGMDEMDSEYTPYPSDKSSMTDSDSSISMAAAEEEEEEEESEVSGWDKECRVVQSGILRSDEGCESEFGDTEMNEGVESEFGNINCPTPEPTPEKAPRKLLARISISSNDAEVVDDMEWGALDVSDVDDEAAGKVLLLSLSLWLWFVLLLLWLLLLFLKL